jgi:hypothetical protein
MAWSASKIFAAYIVDSLGNTAALDLDGDANLKAALFDNTITPSQVVASANTAYGAGVWASGGVVDASGWPAVGRPLVWASATRLTDYSAATVKFDADDTVSANDTTTLTNAYGVHVYDDTITTPVADQGICYNYLGGANSVVAGTFTLVWSSANGVFSLAL